MVIFHDMSVADPTERADRWEHALAAEYTAIKVTPASGSVGVGTNFLSRIDLDDIRLVDLRSTTCSATRLSKGDNGDDEHLALIIVRRGREIITSAGGSQAVLTVGDAVLWDTSQHMHFVVDGTVLKQNLLIPRRALNVFNIDVSSILGKVVRSPLVLTLSALAEGLGSEAHTMHASQLLSARNALFEMIGALLRGESDGDRPHGTRRAVDQWLEKNLQANFTAQYVAAVHLISVRTLNRLYEGDGESFSRYVRRLRLERARQDLLSTDDLITTIASRWQFADASHFTRRFVAEYNITPSAAREGQRRVRALAPHSGRHEV